MFAICLRMEGFQKKWCMINEALSQNFQPNAYINRVCIVNILFRYTMRTNLLKLLDLLIIYKYSLNFN